MVGKQPLPIICLYFTILALMNAIRPLRSNHHVFSTLLNIPNLSFLIKINFEVFKRPFQYFSLLKSTTAILTPRMVFIRILPPQKGLLCMINWSVGHHRRKSAVGANPSYQSNVNAPFLAEISKKYSPASVRS